jgi:hypothetical protein
MPLENHRGPFTLQVCRLTPTRKVKYHTETLRGALDRDDVADEARMLLTDPRDTIDAVYVFSVPEQQHVMTYTRKAVR